MESASSKDMIRRIIVYIILIIMAFIMLVPFAWMILTALKTNQEAISVDPFYIFPSNGWHWETFGEVWQSYNFVLLYKNTLLMIFFRVVCACLTATMAGYAFGRLEFPGKKFLFSLVLIQMMIPSTIFIIPQYLMVSSLGWLNTTAGLVFPGIVTAFGTYLLKTGYQGLPKDLEEAAGIDGCNIGMKFLMIMMPLTRSSMVSLGIFTAHDRLLQRTDYDACSRPCKGAGTVRKQLSADDGSSGSRSRADDRDLCDLPETVRRRYRYLRWKAVIGQ